MDKPTVKPSNPCFSSGPCAKRPRWSAAALDTAMAGRSHRSSPAKAELKAVIDKHRVLLNIPDDYHIGIVPGSDTGAFEMAMWGLLGSRGVDVFAWESFSGDWLKDITNELKLDDVRTFEADFGELPDLSAADPDRDCVFAWNGTTSGVRVPHDDWIKADRGGLTLCDATSGVFAYDLPWEKLDVVTWSWQKVLGGEAAHGMLVLSPRAVERLENYTPPWPLPKVFRLMKGGTFNADIFKGVTINTPSMLAVADCLDALGWVEDIGGVGAAQARIHQSFSYVDDWINQSDWATFLCKVPEQRSLTSICLDVKDPWFKGLESDAARLDVIVKMCALLDDEKVAYDIKSYKSAPPGIRIWCGATVEPDDIKILLPWLDWAYAQVKA